MKKAQKFLLIAGIIFAIISCKKDNTENPVPAPGSNYLVTYKMEMNGNYDSLIVLYIDSTQTKQQVLNPNMPWQKDYDDFKKGDSVYFNVSFVSDSISYTFEVSIDKPVSGGHSYFNGTVISESFVLQDTLLPVNLNFSYLIE